VLVNMEGAEDHIIELRIIIAPYFSKDIYNMDETGLYWKDILNTILVIKL